MYRGSRKHVLDWTGKSSFLAELADLLAPIPLRFSAETRYMPQGYDAPQEARLNRFGPKWLPGTSAWSCLEDWWLVNKVGANTPNWDIAVGCETEGRPGLVLVEAKANWPELGLAGKGLSKTASAKAHENHERIGTAINEACAGWRQLDGRVCIQRESHYQLANRLAFTWKLAALGIPVVLLYLGFTGDEGIRNAGAPFMDDADWQRAFGAYISGVVPLDLFSRRVKINQAPVWLVSRSRPVMEVSADLAKDNKVN